MNITTKYNQGEVVHFMHDDKPLSGIISGICTGTGSHPAQNGGTIKHDEGYTSVMYALSIDHGGELGVQMCPFMKHELNVYATRDELQAAVFAQTEPAGLKKV